MSASPPLILYPGVPPASAFSVPWLNGSPIIIDRTTNIPYYWNSATGAVTAFAGGSGAAPVSSPTIKQATITLPYSSPQGSATVIDAGVTALNNILVSWGSCLDTDANSPEMDDVSFFTTSGTGTFTVTITSSGRPIGGPFRINYLLG